MISILLQPREMPPPKPTPNRHFTLVSDKSRPTPPKPDPSTVSGAIIMLLHGYNFNCYLFGIYCWNE